MNYKIYGVFSKLIILLFFYTNITASNNFTDWWCQIHHGIDNVQDSGNNGFMLSGYAYHTSVSAHWPTGGYHGLNEIPYGAGYIRTYYDHDHHEEYGLVAIAFNDSFFKPELHLGYIYQKFHSIFNQENFQLGLGYTPMIFIKPSWSNDAPLIYPGVGLISTLKYKNFSLMATFANVIFFNLRYDFI